MDGQPRLLIFEEVVAAHSMRPAGRHHWRTPPPAANEIDPPTIEMPPVNTWREGA